MLHLADDTPIIACSSSVTSNSAIALIRLSGFKNLQDFQSVFNLKLSTIKPRSVYYCDILNNNLVIDSICLTYFKGPNSFNGENILELSVHGNLLNVERIVQLFTNKFNLRRALPGEFSYRALKNKKLSLTQVEGLDLFLNSNSEYSLDFGNSILNGSLSKLYKNLYNAFKTHLSSVELAIDFLDDIGEENFKKNFDSSLNNLNVIVKELSSRADTNISSINNPKVLVFGKTNAGKSSFFNNILKRKRSIVSDVHGTTRDYISEIIKIENNFFELIDTAGIRDTSDQIEKEGINFVNDLKSESFFIIQIINPLDEYEIDNDSDLVIFTHSDLFKEKVNNLNKKYLFIDNYSWSKVAELEIFSEINKKFKDLVKNGPILIPRHIEVINNLQQQINNYNNLSSNEVDIAIISSELNLIGHSIQELIGIVTPDEVLNNIFTNFCIGK